MNLTVLADRLRGYPARIDADGNLSVKPAGTTEVSGAVDVSGSAVDVSGAVDVSQPPQEQTSQSGDEVDSGSSTEILEATAGRQALYVCVTGESPVAIRFGEAATEDDFRLEPGEKFTFYPAPEGSLNAYGIGGGSYLAVIEVKPVVS
jgi:hypothetical protein